PEFHGEGSGQRRVAIGDEDQVPRLTGPPVALQKPKRLPQGRLEVGAAVEITAGHLQCVLRPPTPRGELKGGQILLTGEAQPEKRAVSPARHVEQRQPYSLGPQEPLQ